MTSQEMLAWYRERVGLAVGFSCAGGHWWTAVLPDMYKLAAVPHPSRSTCFKCSLTYNHCGSIKAVPDFDPVDEAAQRLGGYTARQQAWSRSLADQWRMTLLNERRRFLQRARGALVGVR